MKRALALLLTAASCGGSTGNDHVHFSASAAGPSDATGAPFDFMTGAGYHVVLTKAALHIGGVYLNQTVSLSGMQEAGCYLPGIYVAEVIGAVDLDLLSAAPIAFPVSGDGIALDAHAGEVWLTGGAIDAPDDSTVILAVEGTADKGGMSWPFSAALTIGNNRQIPPGDPANPGAHPICAQRIVSPIPLDLTPRDGATLLLRVDPRAYFVSVDFSALPPLTGGATTYQFANAPTNSADIGLYKALHATTGVYQFTFQ